MHDPVADMLTRIRNAQSAKHRELTFIASNLKAEIARVLKEEGYIADYVVGEAVNNIKSMTVKLKYYKGKPVIEKITRISRPGLRIYKSASELGSVPGFGVKILSTSQGVMTHLAARKNGIGGEIICEVA